MNSSRKVGARLVIWPAACLFLALSLVGCGNGDDDSVIRISGNIELTEVKVSFKTSGKLVERNFDEGDSVEAGQVVARLDREQLLRQKDQAKAGLTAALSQLRQLRTSIEYQRETIAGQVEERKAHLAQAKSQLAELEAGSRSQEIQQARARVEEAATGFERAKADWERAQPLYASDDISRAQNDQYKARYEAAKAQLEQAREALGLVEEGPRRETIQQARARVDQARAAVRLAEAQRLELRRREQEIETRRAEIEHAEAQVALIETLLEDTVARAPISGTVLAESAEEGEVLAAGTTVLTIGDLANPWLRGYINETDLGRVKIGSPVRITTDTYPDKVYEGRVAFISSEAEFTPKQIQTEDERVKLVYRIKVEVNNPDQELKLNMPADGAIVLE